MFFITILLGLVVIVYIWLRWNYSYWKLKNVSGPEPMLLFGNFWSVFTMKKHVGVAITDWYKDYSNEPYVGIYKLLRPAIILRDTDTVKDILSTNFDCFRNNDSKVSKKYDSLAATNPFFKDDDEWKEARKSIAPMFSQSKLKNVQYVTNEVGADLVKFIKSFPAKTDFNAKELATRFTTENVVKTTFSVEPRCFDEDDQNEFIKVGQSLFSPTFLAGLKFAFKSFMAKWMIEHIPVSFIPAATDRWFRKFVQENKALRSEDHQSNDLFQVLLQIQQKHNYDEEILAGHSISLFFDGTETSATALSYTMYELARNPHCQDILYNEVRRVLEKYDDKLTYEALQEMTYLEGSLFESIRINPPILHLGKLCTKQYTLPKTANQIEPTTISPGTTVYLPIHGIHMDPNLYHAPEEFKPERFSPEEQKKSKFIFLAFGGGPRICPGMRFAIIQIKVALAFIALNFRIKLSPNHKPITLDPQALISYPKDGILLNFEAR